ncbi:hypothetical protein Hanom_Chr05g00386081 [Helianthus anomalus]
MYTTNIKPPIIQILEYARIIIDLYLFLSFTNNCFPIVCPASAGTCNLTDIINFNHPAIPITLNF